VSLAGVAGEEGHEYLSSGLPQPVTGSHPGPALYPVTVCERDLAWGIATGTVGCWPTWTGTDACRSDDSTVLVPAVMSWNAV
jgi:hypothetical protein